MAAIPYSDLEVAPNSHAQDPAGLEYDHYQSDIHNQKEAVSTAFIPAKADSSPERKRICGLPAKTFWIAVVVAIIVIAGAVGGGVGGSIASKSSSNSAAPNTSATTTPAQDQTTSSSSSAASSSTSASKTTIPPQTTTTIIGPKYTIVRDCPSSNDTLYSVTYGPTTQSFRKTCADTVYIAPAFVYGNVVDQSTSSLESCINVCANWNVQKAASITSGQAAVCNAVCWRNSLAGDEFPGRCFGYPYPTQNGTTSDGSKVQFSGVGKCDSGVWVDQRPL